MEKKVAIVTGATGAIGKAIARQIAEHLDFKVVLVCRNKIKAESAASEIKKVTGNNDVNFEIVDLSLSSSIQNFARRWQGPLHVLVNNAAITPVNKQVTVEGIEMQFATNVLGYFWMIEAFTGKLKESSPSRIINVASYWAGNLDLADLEFKKRSYNNNTAYRQSKQANRMLTISFANKLKPYNIFVNACHPGDVNSKLSNDLGFGGFQSADEGAKTPVWLATEEIGMQETGKFFENMHQAKCVFSNDMESITALHNICNSYQEKISY